MSLRSWKLPEHLNVFQISLLSAGFDPRNYKQYNSEWPSLVYDAASVYLTSVQTAARMGKLEFHHVRAEFSNDEFDWSESLIGTGSYARWLKERDHRDKFFNPDGPDIEDDLLCPFTEYYAPKLAAAVEAWRAVTSNPSLLNGKTPKQAIETWLRENAASYQLLRSGKPNTTAIEEICKVANWSPQGGAPKTPTRLIEPTSPSSERGRQVTENPAARSALFDEDVEIPF